MRPLVEYCTPAWSPHLKKDIDTIENVQRYFTRRLAARCNFTPGMSYLNRLKSLDLEPLEVRRIHYDLKMCYSIIHKENELVEASFFTRAPSGSRVTRGHCLKLFVKHTPNNISKYSFANRVVPIWNSLPAKLPQLNDAPLVTAANAKLFSKRLKNESFLKWTQFDRHM